MSKNWQRPLPGRFLDKWFKLWRAALIAAAVLPGLVLPVSAQVNIYVAASLAELVETIAKDFEAETGNKVSVIVAGTSSLAQQIVAGAPADIFVSANEDWLNYVQNKAEFGIGEALFSNRLAIIARADSKIEIGNLSDLPKVLGDRRLAMGDPNFVPGGIYARQALNNVAVWDELKERVAPTANVREAVQLVAAGAAPLGIVYASDARDERVRIVLPIDPTIHSEIIYWGALSPNAGLPAKKFLDYMLSEPVGFLAMRSGFSMFEGAVL